MAEKIIFFDTTLRDGEQASGFHMLLEEKLAVAKQLGKLGVDIIEAGFPASSPGDYEAVRKISEMYSQDGPVICALSRAKREDIEKAASAIGPAKNKRIHTFIATSDIHVNGKFRKDREWIKNTAVVAVKLARSYVEDVEFSCEDFGRSDLDYIVEVVCAAIEAGASTINLPDTVGWLYPDEAYERVEYVIKKVREKGLDAVFSVHNHNDFGMATANTIEGIRAGVRQVEVTINGIGERAGNTSLEEIAAILKTRESEGFDYTFNLDTMLIGETSRLVSAITKVTPQPNKAVVGKNAFAHEAGIHQDGVLKDSSTYETMDPSDYGVESVITFGPRSGRNALRARYMSLGIELSDEEFEASAVRFILDSDRKKETDDSDVILSVKGDMKVPVRYSLVSYTPVHDMNIFGAYVELNDGEETRKAYAEGNGQIDAIINSIKKLTGRDDLTLTDFRSVSEGKGSSALGYTRIVLTKNGFTTVGYSTHPDVVTSAVTAYLECLNKMEYIESYFNDGGL